MERKEKKRMKRVRERKRRDEDEKYFNFEKGESERKGKRWEEKGKKDLKKY